MGFQSTNAFHADSPGVYTSEKKINLNTIDMIQLKCDVVDGSIQCGKRQPVFSSFALDKAVVVKSFMSPKQFIIKSK